MTPVDGRDEPPRPLGDMPTSELREAARSVAEWITNYLDDVGAYPVLARVSPGEIRGALPPEVPEEGEAFDALFRDFQELVLPGVTHWNHPGFFASSPLRDRLPGFWERCLRRP